jgi:ferric-dicitrate binding protein FerR (iron transport regulator)
MTACKQAQALLFERADGRLGPNARAELEAHLSACPHCKQVFAAWTSALPRLRSLPIEEPSEVSVRRMENEVMRETQAMVSKPRLRWPLGLAFAAGLVLLAGLAALSLRSTAHAPFARIDTLWGRVTLSGVTMSQGATIGPGGVLEIAGEGEASFLVGRAADLRLFGPGKVALGGTTREPRLRLDGGRLAVQIKHRQVGESFTIATAHGRVEVRGTRFMVGYGPDGSYVHVEEGEVAAFRVGVDTPVAVKAGETFSLSVEASSEQPTAPVSDTEANRCPKSNCSETGARVRRAMRVGSPARALDLVDEAMGRAMDCPPEARCLDELGYLRAEALGQSGRVEAAVAAYRSLNRAGAPRAMRQNALYAAGLLERRLGRAEDARRSFEQALAVNPDGALAEEALANLVELADPASAEARTTAEHYLSRYPKGMAATRARRILSDAASNRR